MAARVTWLVVVSLQASLKVNATLACDFLGKLPEGEVAPFVYYESVNYWLQIKNTSTDVLRYEDTKKRCEDQSAQLAKPVPESLYDILKISFHDKFAWVGIENHKLVENCKANKACDGIFVWSNGEPANEMSHFTWAGIYADSGVRCMAKNRKDDLNDMYCGKTYGYICQLECPSCLGTPVVNEGIVAVDMPLQHKFPYRSILNEAIRWERSIQLLFPKLRVPLSF